MANYVIMGSCIDVFGEFYVVLDPDGDFKASTEEDASIFGGNELDVQESIEKLKQVFKIKYGDDYRFVAIETERTTLIEQQVDEMSEI